MKTIIIIILLYQETGEFQILSTYFEFSSGIGFFPPLLIFLNGVMKRGNERKMCCTLGSFFKSGVAVSDPRRFPIVSHYAKTER